MRNRFKQAIAACWNEAIDDEAIDNRAQVLEERFDNQKNIQPLLEKLFGPKVAAEKTKA